MMYIYIYKNLLITICWGNNIRSWSILRYLGHQDFDSYLYIMKYNIVSYHINQYFYHFLSIYLSIYLSMYPSISVSTHPSSCFFKRDINISSQTLWRYHPIELPWRACSTDLCCRPAGSLHGSGCLSDHARDWKWLEGLMSEFHIIAATMDSTDNLAGRSSGHMGERLSLQSKRLQLCKVGLHFPTSTRHWSCLPILVRLKKETPMVNPMVCHHFPIKMAGWGPYPVFQHQGPSRSADSSRGIANMDQIQFNGNWFGQATNHTCLGFSRTSHLKQRSHGERHAAHLIFRWLMLRRGDKWNSSWCGLFSPFPSLSSRFQIGIIQQKSANHRHAKPSALIYNHHHHGQLFLWTSASALITGRDLGSSALPPDPWVTVDHVPLHPGPSAESLPGKGTGASVTGPEVGPLGGMNYWCWPNYHIV